VTVPECYSSEKFDTFDVDKTLPCDNLCGESVTFDFDESNGRLIISGTGNMYEFNGSYTPPWSSYKSSIKSVVITTGVTSVGSYSFSGCIRIESVTIGSSVISIGSHSFSGCTGIKSVTIGSAGTFFGSSALTSIGSSAFSDCVNLEHIEFFGTESPSYVGSVFSGCSKLKCVNVHYYYESDKFCNVAICGDSSSQFDSSLSHGTSSHSGLINTSSASIISPLMTLFVIVALFNFLF